MIALHDCKTAKEAIFKDPEHPVVQILFPPNVTIFQNDFSPWHTGKHSQRIYKLFSLYGFDKKINNTDLQVFLKDQEALPS